MFSRQASGREWEMLKTPESEPYNTGKRKGTLKRVVNERQNFFQILPPGWRGNLMRLTIIWHNCYLNRVIFVCNCLKWQRTYFHSLWDIERWVRKRKSGVQSLRLYCRDFCNITLTSEENWNSITSYTEVWMKSMKFDLYLRSRIDVWIPSQILLRNPDADMNVKPNGQTETTSR